MVRLNRWMSVSLIVVLMLASLSPVGGGHVARAQGPPQPFPEDCDDITPVPEACCLRGYVYHDGAPLDGAGVRIDSAQGHVDLATSSGAESPEPYYGVVLSEAPLSVSPGELITITASYGGMVSARTWTVQADGQQVDVGLLTGYQTAEPVAGLAGYAPATDVGGVIDSNTTWTLAGSPYVVTSNVLVDQGVRLTIDPGVQVRFNAGRALQIDGELIARGTDGSPITFTSNVGSGKGDWGYILFTDDSVDATYDLGGNYLSGSVIQYAVVEYGGGANVSENGTLRIDASSPFIDHTTIRHSETDGIHVWNGVGVRITNNHITGNGIPASVNAMAVYVAGSGAGTALIAGNTIVGNTSGIAVNVATATIRGNTISDNVAGNGGIDITGGEAAITDNTITGNERHVGGGDGNGGGIHICGGSCVYGGGGTVLIARNVLTHNETLAGKGGGINNSGGTATIEDNLIAHNTSSGIGGGISSGGYYGGSATISRNLIVDNTASGGAGGGIAIGQGTVANNVVSDNTAATSGGGISCSGGTILDNTIVRNSAANSAAIDYSGDSDVTDNTLLDNVATGIGDLRAVYIAGHPAFNANNLYGNTDYALYNSNAQGTADVDAENNWWGTGNSATIQSLIYDWLDDPNLGLVDYSPYRTEHNTAAPISPPAGLAAVASATAITPTWSANPEGDLAGYKLYYDLDSGFPYSGTGAFEGDSPLDVGNVTSFPLTGLAPGTYYVSVTAYDPAADGVDDQTDGNESWFAAEVSAQVGVPPQAGFTASPTSGAPPLTVVFTDTSSGDVDTWDWDFGDGGSSALQHPAHVYTSTGTYTVTLTASGPGGSDTETRAAYITVDYGAPMADFNASPSGGAVPLTVSFTDLSSGHIVAWDWTFGDGSVSGARHPAHTYQSADTFTVSLTVTGPGGSSTDTKDRYITGGLAPSATIDAIDPDPATQGQDTIVFNGSCTDNDEGGAFPVAYEWSSDLDGRLSDQEDFSGGASELSTGLHTISFRCQDDEGQWSAEASRTLTVSPPAGDVRTLILANRGKLEDLYSAAEADQVMAKLAELAAHPSVDGLVEQVENDATVAAAYAAWDADPGDTARANAVTAAIKAVVDAQWAAHPELEYLVLAGDDRVLPFRRVPDQTRYPESHYGSVSCSSTTGAALCDDMTLTDGYYADAEPVVPDSPEWDGHDLYIPDLGTGRLIESPAEIVAQIDTFLAGDAQAAGEAIVTGYDFVEDGAQAVCAELGGDGIPSDCALVGQAWDRDDFIAQVLDTRHDLASINGHASHFAIGTPSGQVDSSDVAAAGVDHTRALFYTVGCHAGLNVPPSNPTEPLDTAQALVQQGANYVANTGYGWGYVTSIGLSEQLMLDFSERLVYGQSATVGQALAAAKQEYYLADGDFDYYDEKILIQSTLYGLPMARYTTPVAGARLPAGDPAATVLTEERMTVLGDGLTMNSISYQFPALLAETTGDGQYYTFADMVHASDGQPIQPKYLADLSFPQTEAHGVVFRGGAYADQTTFNPVVDRAITETATLPEPSFDAPTWYPPVLHRLNRLERGDRLVTVLGQFNPQSQTERVYDRLRFDVYYHTGSGDWLAPTVPCVGSRLYGGTTQVTVRAEDASGIHAVVVAYTDGLGLWDSVPLMEAGGVWTGSLPAGSGSLFFIQVVDGAGNVGVDHNGWQYFWPGEGSCSTVYLPLVTRSP